MSEKNENVLPNAERDLAKENENLKNEIDTLKEQMAAILKAMEVRNTSSVAPTVTVVAPENNVHVKYMSDNLGHMEANGVVLDATEYGETFTLSVAQADALVGKYRHWFKEGILAIAAEDIKYAAAKGLRTDAEFALDAKTLERVGTMSPKEIETLWNKCANEQKLSIVTYFKKKIIENKDPNFFDRERVDTLNRLSNGGFKREVSELSGDYKIRQTDM